MPQTQEKYGHLRLVRGEEWGKWQRGRRGGKRLRLRVPSIAEHELDALMHLAAVHLEGTDGVVPSRGWQEVREGRQRPWRFLARRMLEAWAAGVPKEQALGIVRALEQWVERLYQEQPRHPRRVA